MRETNIFIFHEGNPDQAIEIHICHLNEQLDRPTKTGNIDECFQVQILVSSSQVQIPALALIALLP